MITDKGKWFDLICEINRIDEEAAKQLRGGRFESSEQRHYWQGKKDGLRIAVALMREMSDDPLDHHAAKALRGVVETSNFGNRLTDEEYMLASLSSAVYYMADLLDTLYEMVYGEKKAPHVQTIINAQQWLDNMSRKTWIETDGHVWEDRNWFRHE